MTNIMILKNKKTGKIICTDLKVARSFGDQLLGLLNPGNPRNMLFKTRFGIHTFFMKEPIDVLVLDRKMNIVKVKQELRPNRLFFWNPKYPMVCELSSGTIERFNIKPAQDHQLVD